MIAKLIVWEVLCIALFYSVFCRSVKTRASTRFDVRLAIFFLGVSSLVGLGAPLYGWVPDVVPMMLLASVVLMQAVTARHWVNGVPYHFIDPRSLRSDRRQGEVRS